MQGNEQKGITHREISQAVMQSNAVLLLEGIPPVTCGKPFWNSLHSGIGNSSSSMYPRGTSLPEQASTVR